MIEPLIRDRRSSICDLEDWLSIDDIRFSALLQYVTDNLWQIRLFKSVQPFNIITFYETQRFETSKKADSPDKHGRKTPDT